MKLLGMGGVTIMVLVGISRTVVGLTPGGEEDLPSRLVGTLGVITSNRVVLELLLIVVG